MKLYVEPGYESVADVLRLALEQTQGGKGKERHASGEPFEDQEIMHNARKCGLGSPVGQVRKKVLEAERLAYEGDYERAKNNILGAINYAVAEFLRVDEMEEECFDEELEQLAEDAADILTAKKNEDKSDWHEDAIALDPDRPLQRSKRVCPCCEGNALASIRCRACDGAGKINAE